MFEERLRAALPLAADRVLHRIRETRGGQLYDPRFGVRGRGEGPYADAIRALFETTAARLGFERGGMGMDARDAAPAVETPVDAARQMRRQRQPTSKTCRTIARPPLRSGNRAAARAPS